jgi:O-antigen ligase
LNVLAETGFVGGALYAALMLTVLLGAERVRRRARPHLPHSAQQLLFIELGIIAFLLAGIFGSFTKLAFTYILLALLWSVARTTSEELDALLRARVPR